MRIVKRGRREAALQRQPADHSHLISPIHNMVNVTFSPEGNPIYTQPDGTEVLYNLGDMAWIIVATACGCGWTTVWRAALTEQTPVLSFFPPPTVVWWMIPGVGFLYSGLLRRKNGLSMLMLSVAGLGVGA